jgi:hypothetical protein
LTCPASRKACAHSSSASRCRSVCSQSLMALETLTSCGRKYHSLGVEYVLLFLLYRLDHGRCAAGTSKRRRWQTKHLPSICLLQAAQLCRSPPLGKIRRRRMTRRCVSPAQSHLHSFQLAEDDGARGARRASLRKREKDRWWRCASQGSYRARGGGWLATVVLVRVVVGSDRRVMAGGTPPAAAGACGYLND